MDASGVKEFLDRLGVPRARIKARGVTASCPFASKRHEKGTDTMPSFFIYTDQPHLTNNYSCSACHVEGPGLLQLLYQLEVMVGLDPALAATAYRWVQAQQAIPTKTGAPKSKTTFGLGPFWHGTSSTSKAPPLTLAPPPPVELVLSEDVLKPLSDIPPEVLDYLTEIRLLSEDTLAEFEVGWHPVAQRISLPIRDTDGKLVGLSGRAFKPEQRPKFLHSKDFRRDNYLYGEYHCQTGGVGYVVEGFFDVMFLRQRGYPAVALLGTSLSRNQAQKLCKMFTKVIVVPDGDKAGFDGARKIVGSLPIETGMVAMPRGRDPDQLTPTELVELLGPPPQTP